MFNALAVSMRELELESAELLPSRETLCVTRWHISHHSHGSDGGQGQGYGHGEHHQRSHHARSTHALPWLFLPVR